MNFINLTPHPVTVAGRTFQPDGTVARVTVSSDFIGEIDGIPIVANTYGEVIGLPAERRENIFIVSRMVKDRVPSRKDCLVPEGLVRDGEGNITGCRALAL